MTNEHVYDTNSGPILEAISNNKTVLVYLFSHLDSEFIDVHMALPSLEEASGIYNLASNKPDWEWDLETAMINKFCLVPTEINWLQCEAPAGLVSSICNSLLSFAYPTDSEELELLIQTTRGSQLIYDQFKQLMLEANVSLDYLKKCDVFQLMKAAISSEMSLTRQGILESGFTIVDQKTGTKKVTSRDGSAHVTGHGVIDVEAANAEMKKQGLID